MAVNVVHTATPKSWFYLILRYRTKLDERGFVCIIFTLVTSLPVVLNINIRTKDQMLPKKFCVILKK